MGKAFNYERAEQEANKIGLEFAHSNDVVKDMSRAYNVDFSNIKVHTDSAADSKVKAAGKDALAQGNDIFFGKGIFESNDPADKGLVAHEFAHTMQQGTAMGGEMAVAESAPMGMAQGGIRDWFRRHFTSEGRAARKREKSVKAAFATRANDNTALSDEATQQIMGLSDWAINRSNEYYSASRVRGDAKDMQISSAYQGLGHRVSTERTGAVDVGIRKNEVFKDMNKTYAAYFGEREKQGANYDTMYDGVQEVMLGGGGAAKYFDNKGVSEVTSDLLSILGNTMMSKKGIDYMKVFRNQVKGADIFDSEKGMGLDPMNFLMNTILTGELGNVSNAVVDRRGSDVNHSKKQDVGIKAARNLQVLPVVQRMSEEEREALPATLRSLYQQYEALLAKISAAMEGTNI